MFLKTSSHNQEFGMITTCNEDVKNAVKLGCSGIAENPSSTVTSLGGETTSCHFVLEPEQSVQNLWPWEEEGVNLNSAVRSPLDWITRKLQVNFLFPLRWVWTQIKGVRMKLRLQKCLQPYVNGRAVQLFSAVWSAVLLPRWAGLASMGKKKDG